MKTALLEVADLLSPLSASGVEKMLLRQPGVHHVAVNPVDGTALVHYDESADDARESRRHRARVRPSLPRPSCAPSSVRGRRARRHRTAAHVHAAAAFAARRIASHAPAPRPLTPHPQAAPLPRRRPCRPRRACGHGRDGPRHGPWRRHGSWQRWCATCAIDSSWRSRLPCRCSCSRRWAPTPRPPARSEPWPRLAAVRAGIRRRHLPRMAVLRVCMARIAQRRAEHGDAGAAERRHRLRVQCRCHVHLGRCPVLRGVRDFDGVHPARPLAGNARPRGGLRRDPCAHEPGAAAGHRRARRRRARGAHRRGQGRGCRRDEARRQAPGRWRGRGRRVAGRRVDADGRVDAGVRSSRATR